MQSDVVAGWQVSSRGGGRASVKERMRSVNWHAGARSVILSS